MKKILTGYQRRIEISSVQGRSFFSGIKVSIYYGPISSDFFCIESLQIFGLEIFVKLIRFSEMIEMNPRILIVRVIYPINIEVNRSFSSNVTYIIKVDSTMKRTYTRCATSKGSVKTGSMRNEKLLSCG